MDLAATKWLNHPLLFDYACLFMLIFTRFLIITIIVPFLGARLLANLLKIALALSFSIIGFLLLFKQLIIPLDKDAFFILLLLIKEAFIGLIIGFMLSLIFYLYEMCGQLIDLARSATLARQLVPELQTQSSLMGSFLWQMSIAVFLSLGLYRPAIQAMYKSFELFPVFLLSTKPLEASIIHTLMGIVASLFKLSFNLALPVIVSCFFIDLGFGLLNKAAPQINAYFLAMPAKMLGGLVIFLLGLAFLMDDFVIHHQLFFPSFLK